MTNEATDNEQQRAGFVYYADARAVADIARASEIATGLAAALRVFDPDHPFIERAERLDAYRRRIRYCADPE